MIDTTADLREPVSWLRDREVLPPARIVMKFFSPVSVALLLFGFSSTPAQQAGSSDPLTRPRTVVPVTKQDSLPQPGSNLNRDYTNHLTD